MDSETDTDTHITNCNDSNSNNIEKLAHDNQQVKCNSAMSGLYLTYQFRKN